MKNIVHLFLTLTFAAVSWAEPPEPPRIAIRYEDHRATLTFKPVPGARGYRLYYAPYPELRPIRSIELGTKTRFSAALSPEQAYAVAVRAYNRDGESGYSNIEIVQIDKALSGGAATVFDRSRFAFSQPVPTLDEEARHRHGQGDRDFEAVFVTAPASVHPGLGPLFNNRSCESCHVKDGRGRPADERGELEALFLRLSLPGEDPVTGGPLPVPGFGTQLMQRAVFGKPPHAKVRLRYEPVKRVELAGGEEVILSVPRFEITEPYRPLPRETLLSPRLALPVFGTGLLEAVPEEAILALADPEDRDGDGISGRPNWVWHPLKRRLVLGRFGWKANTPDLLIQTAAAYRHDIGITNPIFPEETAKGLPQDDDLLDDPEIGWQTLEDVVFYLKTLAVPARRDLDDPQVKWGELLFASIGCASCHVPTLKTGEVPGMPFLSHQVIHPYTDLLLHDMGEELADHRPDFEASGREWRTPPLWGIGLAEEVLGEVRYLHDGRARTLLEAILWHGGEAESARERFRRLSKAARRAILAFLKSL